jgi:prepilin-type N-terminal cleavage/methylation domain-containing protein
MRRCTAFTLIELLVVVAIIALLIAILLPSLAKARETAKLVLCGTQQREIANAVNVYAAGNKGVYPPSIQGFENGTNDWWTLPNRINYHPVPYNAGGVHGFDDGWLARRLFNYIPQVKIYFCPLSPDQPLDAQQIYETGKSNILNASYFMYWGYDGYMTQPPRYFRGPQRVSDARGNQLLTCDQLSWNEPGGSSYWNSAHRFDEAGPVVASNPAGSVESEWRSTDPTETYPEALVMNGSYVDGHVERYAVTENETDWYHPGLNGSHISKHYIPTGQ